MSPWGLLCPLGMGAQSEEEPQQKVCCKAGEKNGGPGLGGIRGQDVHLAYLLCWLQCFTGSQGISVGFGDWAKAMSAVKEVWKGRSV